MAKQLTKRQQRRQDRIAAQKAAQSAAPPSGLPDMGVSDKLSAPEQDIYTSGEGLTNQALDLAGQNLGGTKLGTAFEPTLAERTTSGDLLADRQRIEEEVFGRLTRDMDQNFAKDQQQLEQTLANKGIPFGSERYKQEMQNLNDRYDRSRLDARRQATELGGGEFSRSFGIGEQLRANQLSEQQGIRNQQLGEVGTLANTGPGLQNFFNMAGIQNQEDQLALQKFIAQLQAKTAKGVAKINQGGSGGGGLTPDQQAAKDEAAAGF